MISEGTGNLITTEAEALVNTVNTVGIMGKGVALQFKQAFPANFKEYERACKKGDVRIGKMFVTHTGMLMPRLIINFPTKEHWRSPATLNNIRAGLSDLIDVIQSQGVASVALPPLGCGLGGLRWEEVRPLIEDAFKALPNVDVVLFAPGTAMPLERVIRTAKPNLTTWGAALIRLVKEYSHLGFEASHQEAQKLVYFLVSAGEPLRVEFSKGDYGPYDDGMRHALLGMEGHYVNGFGEGKRLDPVSLAAGAFIEADRMLQHSPETEERVRRVASLIAGFESPYGLELLATVHWVATREGAGSEEEAIALAHSWCSRKRSCLKAEHLRVAWNRLHELKWI